VIEGGGFRLRGAAGPRILCVRCALRERPLLRRSACVALVVGSVLTAINQGDVILGGGGWSLALVWKLPLTYATPFCVATWGALANSRMAPRREAGDAGPVRPARATREG
jgi:hypothetical protein